MLSLGNIKSSVKSAYGRLRGYSAFDADALTPAQRAQWSDEGYVVLPSFFRATDVDPVNRYVDDLWDNKLPEAGVLVVDSFIGSKRERRAALRDTDRSARRTPYKLNDLYLESPLVRDVVLDPKLVGIVGALMGGVPLVCNTLSLEFGSQQDFHTDSLYMSPPKDLNLVASWIALEDCHPDAGPLVYYPGSHRIPPYRFSTGEIRSVANEMPQYREYMRAEIAKRNLAPQSFCAKKGDVFIWHGQLFHGGSPITNPTLTRKSLVTHYYLAGDVLARHGQHGPGRLYLRRPHAEIPR